MRASISALIAGSWSSSSSSARGWIPIWRLMMNSSRASPIPLCGNRENSNAWSGVPTFIMIFTSMSGMSSRAVSVTENFCSPS